MTLSTTTFSKLAVSVLVFSSVSELVNGQIRRRNGPPQRILEQVAWDPQEHVLVDEPRFMEEMEWADFSMQGSLSLSMSMMPCHGSSKKSSKGPKGDDFGNGSTSMPLEIMDMGVNHKDLLKRSPVQDDHSAMKLVKR